MKKIILGVLSFASLGAVAQTFTVNDTVSAGDSQLFYTADSSVANLDGITGTGVTWDYSTLQMYSNATNPDTIKYASDSPDYGNYPNAEYHDDISQGTSNYFSNLADSVISWGYKFVVNGNNAMIMYDTDQLKMVDLPMSQGDTYTDSVAGTAEVFGNSAVVLGEATITADGFGTLELGSTTFTNVLRIKLQEQLEATITLGTFGTVTGIVTRTTYTYYDLSNQKMPIMVHATIDVNSTQFNGTFKAVYSSVQLDLMDASFGEEIAGNIEIYPNPANQQVTINSPEKVDELVVLNTLGQTMISIKNPQQKEILDVNSYDTGVYFIQLKKGNATKTQKLIVK